MSSFQRLRTTAVRPTSRSSKVSSYSPLISRTRYLSTSLTARTEIKHRSSTTSSTSNQASTSPPPPPAPAFISNRLKAFFSKSIVEPSSSSSSNGNKLSKLDRSSQKLNQIHEAMLAGDRAALGAVEADRRKLRERALRMRAVENQKRASTSQSMKEAHFNNHGKKEESRLPTIINLQSSTTTSSLPPHVSPPSRKLFDPLNALEYRLDKMLSESEGMGTLAVRLQARGRENALRDRLLRTSLAAQERNEKKEAKRLRREALKLSKKEGNSEQELDSSKTWNALAKSIGGLDDHSSKQREGIAIPVSEPSDSLSELWGTDTLEPSSESGFPTTSDLLQRDVPAHLDGPHSFAARAPSPTPYLPPSFSRKFPSSVRERGRKVTTLVYGGEALLKARVIKRPPRKETDTSQLDSDQLEAREKARIWSEQRQGRISGPDVPVEKVEPLRPMEVPPLAHGLDRVLFNPGVYWLRDPRSGIYNFDPTLRKILDVDLFDYSALPPYITSSKDEELIELTRRAKRKFCGSTSSMTAVLSQCYFLLSGWRDPDTSGFSAPFDSMLTGFSAGAKLPASILLNHNPPTDPSSSSTYAIDSDKAASGESENNNYVLTQLGKSMEKLLTCSPEEFQRFHRLRSRGIGEEERGKKESYHYAMTDKLMMRSQLDCQDSRLPRQTFDLKTRAVLPIRSDRANWVEHSGYQIRNSLGLIESFEREYFDMVRAAFLKYSFQARIGHMDGIFVAYHNTGTMFGFQYFPLEEMNNRIFGSTEMAEQAFRLCLALMERILEVATELFPNETLKLTFETPDPTGFDNRRDCDAMKVFVEPASVEAPDESASTASAEEGSNSDVQRSRKIAQLEIKVDRYLDDGLVEGPVDFSAPPGRAIDPATEDEIEKRMREALPPVKWEVDYSITPLQISETEIQRNLKQLRVRQRRLGVLTLPNVEAINVRDQEREAELAQDPEALLQFLEDRASGVAAGMPRAPGQHEPTDPSSIVKSIQQKNLKLQESDETREEERSLASTSEAAAAASLPSLSPTSWKKVSPADQRMRRMRELSRLGAQDAKEREEKDTLQMYERRD